MCPDDLDDYASYDNTWTDTLSGHTTYVDSTNYLSSSSNLMKLSNVRDGQSGKTFVIESEHTKHLERQQESTRLEKARELERLAQYTEEALF